MAYNVYHTYMRDQQCWASSPGYTIFLYATLFFNSASVLLNNPINCCFKCFKCCLGVANTYKHHHTEMLHVFTIFVSLSTPRSIYNVFT